MISNLLVVALSLVPQDPPLRVFLRGGPKTHGPEQHEHERWVGEWQKLLSARGARVDGATRFPTASELERTDVLVLYAADAGSIHGAERADLERFLARGGGIVALHDAVCGDDPQWWKTVVGGAWEHGHAQWHEGLVDLYVTDRDHPISAGISNFRFEDEIYTNLHMAPEARVLVRGFHSVFDASPQAWTYEKDGHRAFVAIQGHEWKTFAHPAWRTLVLRGIAWAGRRDVESLTVASERAELRYPPGGPLAPEKSAAALELHPDFVLSLAAAEPLVVKPISIDWDARGRLWVAETPGYPEKERFSGVPAHDEISILRDSDGDGRMDAKTVFAGGLDLVSSLLWTPSGVVVSQSPEILLLRDTNGDDVADVRTVLFSGFGFADTHAVVSNLRLGPDGCIYATQGYSGNASRHVVNQAGRDFGHVGNGLFRFKLDGSAIEMISSYGSNTWGCDFDDAGELFFSMANGAHLRHVVVPERVFAEGRLGRVESWADCPDHDKVVPLLTHEDPAYAQIDFVGGFTAASGCTIYTGGAWPAKEWNDAAFVCEPTVHIVHCDKLRPDGVTFRATKDRNAEFLAGRDPWFRPVHTAVGPDGALYVCDFYNQAVVHNDTRGPEHGPTNAAKRPDRDHMHGRIWRVQHREARPASVVRARATAADAATDDAGWKSRFGSRDPAVRARAARSVDAATPLTPALRAGLRELSSDRDARVRLAALVALGDIGGDVDPALVSRLVSAWDAQPDPWTKNATLRILARASAATFRSITDKGLGTAEDLAVEIARRAARRGDGATCAGIATLASSRTVRAQPLVEILDVLARDLAAGSRPALDADCREILARLLADGSIDVASAALRLVTAWDRDGSMRERTAALAAHLTDVLADARFDVSARVAALTTLLTLPEQRATALDAAHALFDPTSPPDRQIALVEALATSDDPAAARALCSGWSKLTSAGQERAFEKLTTRASWTRALLDEIEAGRVAARDLGPQKTHRLRNHPDENSAALARQLLAGGAASSAEIDALVRQLLPEVDRPGDAAHGKLVFEQHCAACHVANGAGGHVGPDLSGMGAHGARALLPVILDPNRAVEAAFSEWKLVTKDERLFAGVLAREGADSILLRWNGGEAEIARTDIDTIVNSGRSPMPTGLEKIGAEGLRDVIAYLSKGTEGFRVLDVEPVTTRNSLAGLYDRRHANEILAPRAFGIVEALGVPFELLDPARTSTGNNAVVLKGGTEPTWDCKRLPPQRVEVPVGCAVTRVHVLGGIAAWGYPFHREKTEILKWTWNYEDGEREEVVLRNGVEFGDWIARHDVPGSEYVEGLLAERSWGQVRFHSLAPSKPERVIRSIELASYDNLFAPTILALTAELPGAKRTAPTPPAAREPAPLDAFVFGGGSSHDFRRWFGEADLATLAEAGIRSTYYTERVEELVPQLALARVLVLANNQPLASADVRLAIFEFVERGGALLLLHAATWFNWPDWTEFNADLVGGGARGHEAYAEFTVQRVGGPHPVLRNVADSFVIEDELYQTLLTSGNEVLATGRSRTSGAEYPCVWTRAFGRGRILSVTLGHDGAAHGDTNYRTLLGNGVRWLLESTRAR